jgi:hypothetical protein
MVPVASRIAKHLEPFSWKGTSDRYRCRGLRNLNVLDRWIFLALSLLGLRQWLARIMPQSLVLAVGAGIGMFIAQVTFILFVPSPLLTRLQFHRTLYATVFPPSEYTS